MPIIIKELVIKARLTDKGAGGESDIEMITNKVLDNVAGDPRLFPPAVKEAIIKETLERVQKLLEERLLR